MSDSAVKYVQIKRIKESKGAMDFAKVKGYPEGSIAFSKSGEIGIIEWQHGDSPETPKSLDDLLSISEYTRFLRDCGDFVFSDNLEEPI